MIIKINIIYIKEGSDANNMGGGRGGGGGVGLTLNDYENITCNIVHV